MDGTPYVCMYASKGPRDKVNPGASQAQAAAKRQPSPPDGERPCKFKICVTKKQAPLPRVPKVSDLIGAATTVPPPEAVLRKLGGATIVVGVDIETADWVDRKNSTSRGQFGFYHFCHPGDGLGPLVLAMLRSRAWRIFNTAAGSRREEWGRGLSALSLAY